MPNLKIEPFPKHNALFQMNAKGVPILDGAWQYWLDQILVQRVQQAAPTQKTVVATGIQASIGATNIEPLANGTYRVNWYLRITQAATTSSSVQVSITATDDGVTTTSGPVAYMANVTGVPQSGSFLVECDPSTPLTYSVTYLSVGATPAIAKLTLIVEGVL